MKRTLTLLLLSCSLFAFAQKNDSSDVESVRSVVTLSEVIVRSDLNVPKFLQRIKYDTSYYKAFKNLHILGYNSLNFIRMNDKSGNPKATLQSKTRQNVSSGCRTMDVLEEKTTGDFYDRHHDYNYYTAHLYAGFFFTNEKVCGETSMGKVDLKKTKSSLRCCFLIPGKKFPAFLLSVINWMYSIRNWRITTIFQLILPTSMAIPVMYSGSKENKTSPPLKGGISFLIESLPGSTRKPWK
jgi:hypothetical protein